MILPFANEKVASYFATMPEEYLFDRKTLKNKLILRDILKDQIGLDSDAIGKMGWVYDRNTLVKENLEYFKGEILSCDYWDNKGIKELLLRFENNLRSQKRKSGIAQSWLYRLYLVSGWLNNCKYLKKEL